MEPAEPTVEKPAVAPIAAEASKPAAESAATASPAEQVKRQFSFEQPVAKSSGGGSSGGEFGAPAGGGVSSGGSSGGGGAFSFEK